MGDDMYVYIIGSIVVNIMNITMILPPGHHDSKCPLVGKADNYEVVLGSEGVCVDSKTKDNILGIMYELR